MASFYADENFPGQAVEALRRRGHEVLTALEAGQTNRAIPDEAVLAFATAQGRALLTMNRWDFIRLHSRRPGHAGLVVCTQHPEVERLASAIHQAMAALASLQGALTRIKRPE